MEVKVTHSQPESVVLITGATDGIGRLVAAEFAARGATVLVHGRDAARCRAVVSWIQDLTGSFRVDHFVADLASLNEVRRLAEQVSSRYPELHVLVNNAGVGPGPDADGPRELSADGHELRFAVNYLAPFLLTRLLLPALERGAPSRVVLVASAAQRAIHFHDIMLEQRHDRFEAYAQSKLALVMFGMELAGRVRKRGITVNALHPGTLLDTKMVREAFGRPQGDPAEGADAILYLATSPDLREVTGKYFDGKRLARAHPQAGDLFARRRLWTRTEALTGLEPWSTPDPAPAHSSSGQ